MSAAPPTARPASSREAIADFDTAIKLNPSFYQAYANRALVQRRLGRDDLALADYNRALQINPSYDVAYIGRGNIYRQSKQTDARARRFQPGDRARHQRSARLPQPRADLPGLRPAAARHRRFLEGDRHVAGNLEPFEGRGLSYLAIGDYKAALEDFNEVVKRDRNSYDGLDQPGPGAREARRARQGLRRLLQGRRLNPNYRPALDGMRRTAGSAGGGVAFGNG